MVEKTIQWAFRIEESLSKELQKIVDNSGLSKIDFFRKLVSDKDNSILPKQDRLKVLYHHNIISNKMNQIAEYAYEAFNNNEISDEVIQKLFHELKQIQTMQQNLISIITAASN